MASAKCQRKLQYHKDLTMGLTAYSIVNFSASVLCISHSCVSAEPRPSRDTEFFTDYLPPLEGGSKQFGLNRVTSFTLWKQLICPEVIINSTTLNNYFALSFARSFYMFLNKDQRWKRTQDGYFHDSSHTIWILMTQHSRRIVWFGKPQDALSTYSQTQMCSLTKPYQNTTLSNFLHYHRVIIRPGLLLPGACALFFISMYICHSVLSKFRAVLAIILLQVFLEC